jgi:hypothetical protein
MITNVANASTRKFPGKLGACRRGSGHSQSDTTRYRAIAVGYGLVMLRSARAGASGFVYFDYPVVNANPARQAGADHDQVANIGDGYGSEPPTLRETSFLLRRSRDAPVP